MTIIYGTLPSFLFFSLGKMNTDSATVHTKLRLNLAGMLSRLESVGTMSSLHQMVHLKPKIALAHKWHP